MELISINHQLHTHTQFIVSLCVVVSQRNYRRRLRRIFLDKKNAADDILRQCRRRRAHLSACNQTQYAIFTSARRRRRYIAFAVYNRTCQEQPDGQLKNFARLYSRTRFSHARRQRGSPINVAFYRDLLRFAMLFPPFAAFREFSTSYLLHIRRDCDKLSLKFFCLIISQ